jgi:cell wall-associated NlpC family hydrolase
MTTVRTTLSHRSTRRLQRGAFALAASAGMLLTPAVAQAAAPAGATVAAAPALAPTAASQKAVNVALAQVGKPYAWGAAGPGSYDCSGLVQYAYKAAGITMPHSSRTQSTMGSAVAKANLKPGDLVFFYSPVSHVGIYIGNGQMVHAATAGAPVKVVNLDYMPSYAGARRLA